MKKIVKIILCVALVLVSGIALVACSSSRSGGGMSRAEISEVQTYQ